jgi:hypothetical protein
MIYRCTTQTAELYASSSEHATALKPHRPEEVNGKWQKIS